MAGPPLPLVWSFCTFQPVLAPADAYDRIITVHVGPRHGETKKFKIYRGLLCFHSGYFNNLLNGSFREGGRNYIRLVDTKVETFQAVYDWLNTDKYRPVVNNTVPLAFQLLAEIYVFADANIIPRLKNAIIDLVADKLYDEWVFPSSILDYVYANTAQEAALRRLLVDYAVATYHWDIRNDDLPAQFLVDTIYSIRNKTVTLNSPSLPRAELYRKTKGQICRYHDHSEPYASDPSHRLVSTNTDVDTTE